MAFEFEVGALGDVEWGANEYIVDFTLGYDLETRERVSMSVALIEDEEGGADPFALTFGLMKTPIDGGVGEGPFFDHTTCREYVSADNAAGVMTLILDAIRKLVDEVQPQSIQMATFEDNLPPEAMAKYYNITNCLGRCGFGMTRYGHDGTDLKDGECAPEMLCSVRRVGHDKARNRSIEQADYRSYCSKGPCYPPGF